MIGVLENRLDIHINWEGPFTLKQALELNSSHDFGLYQYYGDHPVYGENVLLYIGKAVKQTFSQRLSQHNWHLWVSSPVQLYLGRIFAEEEIPESEWESRISLAEKVLIYSHSPAFNTSNLNKIADSNTQAHVYNWGRRKSLLPEASVKRWEGGETVGHEIPNKYRMCGDK